MSQSSKFAIAILAIPITIALIISLPMMLALCFMFLSLITMHPLIFIGIWTMVGLCVYQLLDEKYASAESHYEYEVFIDDDPTIEIPYPKD